MGQKATLEGASCHWDGNFLPVGLSYVMYVFSGLFTLLITTNQFHAIAPLNLDKGLLNLGVEAIHCFYIGSLNQLLMGLYLIKVIISSCWTFLPEF